MKPEMFTGDGPQASSTSSLAPTNEDIITLQLLAELSCLQIFIQDQKQNISEIKIEGNNIS